ncbi:neuronal pentraxin-2-like isoform X1 [Chlorocebus sabaeus]|uniref:neuronal pentraxin-2-like isoform X1 n=1 Tax=Chlorocebus sabaeus TaxID=60711 RepID=UPI003BF950AC
MPIQGGGLSPEEELRAAVLELRQTVLPLKEMLGAPAREAIHEVAGNPARCQGLAGGKARDAEGHGQGHYGRPAAGPWPRPEHFSRSLQTLKDRLKSLEMVEDLYGAIIQVNEGTESDS